VVETSFFFPFLADQEGKKRKGILSRKDLIQLEGKVTRILGPGIMEIQCDNDHTVTGRLSGRMKKYRIKVMVGDSVQVRVSPYDPTHGLITYRIK
jgi:translation initiation factor IF-1